MTLPKPKPIRVPPTLVEEDNEFKSNRTETMPRIFKNLVNRTNQ